MNHEADRFSLFIPETVIGVGAAEDIGKIVKGLQLNKVLIATDEGVVKAGLIEKITHPLEKEGIDVLILGCTDLTCIKGQLRKVLAHHIKIIDPAKQVVRAADEALQVKGWRRLGRREGSFRFYASGKGPKHSKEFAERVFNMRIGTINPCKNPSYH